MEDKKCPLCGKNTKSDETYCDDCLQMAKDEYLDYIKDQNRIDEQVEVDTRAEDIIEEESTPASEEERVQTSIPVKSNKKTIIFLAIGLILLVAIGAIGSYKLKQEREAEEVQSALWERSVGENTSLSYSKYLAKYPEGKFVELAQNKIVELREQERLAWENLLKSDDIQAFYTYLKNHPDSPHKKYIDAKIDSLAWVAANRQNTKEAYQNYLDSVSKGVYVGNFEPFARKRYGYLDQLTKVEGAELNTIKAKMTELAKHLSSSRYDKAQKLATPILFNYFGKENQSTKDVIANMRNMKKENKVRSMTYKFQTDSIEVIKDSAGLYFFDMPVEQKVTYTDRKKKDSISTLSLKVELSKDKLLQSAHLNSNRRH